MRPQSLLRLASPTPISDSPKDLSVRGRGPRAGERGVGPAHRREVGGNDPPESRPLGRWASVHVPTTSPVPPSVPCRFPVGRRLPRRPSPVPSAVNHTLCTPRSDGGPPQRRSNSSDSKASTGDGFTLAHHVPTPFSQTAPRACVPHPPVCAPPLMCSPGPRNVSSVKKFSF